MRPLPPFADYWLLLAAFGTGFFICSMWAAAQQSTTFPWPFSECLEYMKALHVISRDPLCIDMWLERAGLQTSLQDSAKLSLGVISSCAFGAFLRFAPAVLGHYHQMKRLQ